MSNVAKVKVVKIVIVVSSVFVLMIAVFIGGASWGAKQGYDLGTAEYSYTVNYSSVIDLQPGEFELVIGFLGLVSGLLFLASWYIRPSAGISKIIRNE
ncbi:MAG: hypothetical protein Q8P20_02545 [bacterium]|nr:hypothetical protein [bacterium]